jgi:peptidoglycan hydrolase-like protein with peptidoglycan-binding domain
MRNFIRLIFGFISVSLFSFTLAQAQYQSSMNICVNLSTPILHMGLDDDDTEGEVSALQDFLKRKGLLVTNLGGYYGLATTRAVMRYQSQAGI